MNIYMLIPFVYEYNDSNNNNIWKNRHVDTPTSEKRYKKIKLIGYKICFCRIWIYIIIISTKMKVHFHGLHCMYERENEKLPSGQIVMFCEFWKYYVFCATHSAEAAATRPDKITQPIRNHFSINFVNTDSFYVGRKGERT